MFGSFTAGREAYGRRGRSGAIRRGRACPAGARGRSPAAASHAMPRASSPPAAWVMPWRRVLRRIWKAARAMSRTACRAPASSAAAGASRITLECTAGAGSKLAGATSRRRSTVATLRTATVARLQPPAAAASRAATSRWTRKTPRARRRGQLEQAGQQRRGDAVRDVARRPASRRRGRAPPGRRAARRPARPRRWPGLAG